MARDRQKSIDPTWIEARSDDHLRHWSKEFGVDQRTLTSAIRAVGPSVAAVRQYLNERQDNILRDTGDTASP